MTKWHTIANYLTLTRLILIVPMGITIIDQNWILTTSIFLIAIITDVLDGYFARSLNQSTVLGGLFDHTTDALFVSTGLACFAMLTLIPQLLPILIILSFTQYALDSKVLDGQKLIASKIGRANGICYYLLLGISIGFQLLGLNSGLFVQGILMLSWVLCVTTIISMLDRAIALWRHLHAPK